MATPTLGRKNDYADPSTIAGSELNGVADDLERINVQMLELIGPGIQKSTQGNGTAVPASADATVSALVAVCGVSGAYKLVPVVAPPNVTFLYSTNYVWVDSAGALSVTQTNVAPNANCRLLFYGELDGSSHSANINNNPTGRVNLDQLVCGTPATARAYLGLDRAYGELYQDLPAGQALVVTTAGTYYGWTTAGAGTVDGGGGVTTDTTQALGDRLTAAVAGTYEILARASLKGPANANITAAIHKGGAIQANLKAYLEIDGTPKVRTVSLSGYLVLAAGDYVDLRFTSGTNGDSLTLYDVSLLIRRTGP